jgi:hypothetical protein
MMLLSVTESWGSLRIRLRVRLLIQIRQYIAALLHSSILYTGIREPDFIFFL